MKIPVLLVMAILLLTACSPATPSQPLSDAASLITDGQESTTPALSIPEFYEALNAPEVQLIDVRTPEEIAEGKIRSDALELDFSADDFREQVAQLDPTQTYLVNCRSGRRAALSMPVFQELGFEKVQYLDGLIDEYRTYEALRIALDDEYKAWATYQQILADFGVVRPFNNIVRAEEKHIGSLSDLLEKYGYAIPENPWGGKVDRYDSLEAACTVGVEAEIANGTLYDELLQMTDKADVLKVFRSLQSASQDNHLPAFQRCAG